MEEIITIVNLKQVAFYIKKGIDPIKLGVGFKDKMLFFFRKEDTKEVWEAWKRECIEVKNSTLK